MGLLTWVAIAIIAFLLLSGMFKEKLQNIPFLSNLFSTSETDSSSNLPDSIQRGIDFMEQSYGLPLWVWAIIILILIKIK